MSKLSGPRIVAAANYWPELDILIIGIRHWSPDMHRQAQLYRNAGIQIPVPHEQGFVDQHGVFYSRTEAWDIAVENNQIVRDIPGNTGVLYSENLY